ncbi:MAG: hypothetical protein ACE5HO_19340, partial [bacterium]
VASVIVAIFVAAHQVRKYRRQRENELTEMRRRASVERASFWLELRKMFGEYETVHLKLRNGKWPENPSAQQWAELEAYMGLFEHCKAMLNDELLDSETFKNIYGYRVRNLLAYPNIRQKLERNRPSWKLLWALIDQLKIEES